MTFATDASPIVEADESETRAITTTEERTRVDTAYEHCHDPETHSGPATRSEERL